MCDGTGVGLGRSIKVQVWGRLEALRCLSLADRAAGGVYVAM